MNAIASIASRDLDAIQFGPVFDTASKREFGRPQGFDALSRAAEAASEGCEAALIAVGGVTAERAALCRAAGAGAVAVIGAVWDASNVEAAARALAHR